MAGNPKPTIKWEKDGKRIERTIGKVKYSKWAIMLEDLVPMDSGAYTCILCNVHACINHTTRLMVEGNPTFFNYKTKNLIQKFI